MEIGYEEGKTCNRNGCQGVMESTYEESCRCHISPPCSKCTWDEIACSVCGEYHILGEDENWINNLGEKKMLKIIEINPNIEFKPDTINGVTYLKGKFQSQSYCVFSEIEITTQSVVFVMEKNNTLNTRCKFNSLDDAKNACREAAIEFSLSVINGIAKIVE
jgi:hypothetical protein